jgi:hypothetical protein
MNLGTYLSAGFLVTRRIPRPACNAADLLPPTILSASGDLAAFIPDPWAIAWCGIEPDDRRADAAKLGIAPDRVDGVIARVTALVGDETRYGWPNICHSLEAAAEMVRLAAQGGAGLVVLELGLHADDVPVFLEASALPPSPPGTSPYGEPGVRAALRGGRPVLATGRPLGFEPLVYDRALGCSWLCNGLEVPVARALGIMPNAAGLLADPEEARRAVAYISGDGVGAEPGLWLPWLLIEHTVA